LCYCTVEVVLLCLTLEKQGKFAESLDVLRSDRGSNLMIDSIFKQQRVAELLISVDKVNEAIDLYKHLILER